MTATSQAYVCVEKIHRLFIGIFLDPKLLETMGITTQCRHNSDVRLGLNEGSRSHAAQESSSNLIQAMQSRVLKIPVLWLSSVIYMPLLCENCLIFQATWIA